MHNNGALLARMSRQGGAPLSFHRITTTLAIVAALSALPSPRAAAQLPIPSVSLMGGVSQWDLSGTGSSPFASLRVDLPLLFVIGEGSVGAFRAKEQAGTSTYVIPEVQLQWQLLPLLVKPYVGIGGGYFRAISGPAQHGSEFTGSASAGVRVGIPLLGAGLRAEVRARGIGSGFSGSAVEYTAGVSW